MNNCELAVQTMVEQIVVICKELIKHQPADKTERAFVKDKISDSIYHITIADKQYKVRSQFALNVNQLVYVTFPCNDRSNGFVSCVL